MRIISMLPILGVAFQCMCQMPIPVLKNSMPPLRNWNGTMRRRGTKWSSGYSTPKKMESLFAIPFFRCCQNCMWNWILIPFLSMPGRSV